MPATSFAAGANPLFNGVSGNIDYADCQDGDWPRKDGAWLHSDVKKIAFRFVHRFFQKLVNEEMK